MIPTYHKPVSRKIITLLFCNHPALCAHKARGIKSYLYTNTVNNYFHKLLFTYLIKGSLTNIT